MSIISGEIGSNIEIGSGKMESVVLGDSLKKLLDQVFQATIGTNQVMIGKNLAEISTLTATGGPVAASQIADLTEQNLELQKQNVELQTAIQDSGYLSTKVKTA